MVLEETARRDALRSGVPLLTETLVEEDTTEDQYQCCHCKGFCYLSQVTCRCTKLIACVDHADQLCGCAPEKRTLRMRYSEAQLEEILAAVQGRASLPGAWQARFYALMRDSPRPPLKSMRGLLSDGERIQYYLPELEDLRKLVNRANDWVDRATALTTRKSAARRRKGRNADEDDEDDGRRPENVTALLREVDRLAFDSPEILQLRQTQYAIDTFRSEAALILSTPQGELDREKCKTALVLGQGVGIELEEVNQIQVLVNRLDWIQKVSFEVDDRELQYQDVVALLGEGIECDIPLDNQFLVDLRGLEIKGRAWKESAETLLAAKSIELDDITALVENQELTPVVLDLMIELEGIRKSAQSWQTSARQQLEGQGSITSAQRLCKAVKSAHGAQGRVRIPEIALIQEEMEFQTEWIKAVAQTLKIQPKQVAGTLDSIHIALLQQLRLEDERPNDQHSCFCRTPPTGPMVKCTICRGLYHAKCVNVATKNLDQPFKCAMCEGQPYDDRPSMHELACFEDRHRWNFLFPVPELDLISEIVNTAINFARVVQPYLDPHGTAVSCRDVELLSHFARKLYNLPISFDTYNPRTNERIVFEDWLYKRIHDGRNPAKARTRPRKPRLVLKEAREREFACICYTPPPDELARVVCTKCSQEYHATCVFAPEDSVGVEGKSWRCPCCTVKEGKHYGKVAEVRVQMTGEYLAGPPAVLSAPSFQCRRLAQMLRLYHLSVSCLGLIDSSDRLGSDTFVDYRTTVNAFSQAILEYTLAPAKGDCIVLECTRFIGPVIPEGYEPPAITEKDDDDPPENRSESPKKKKRKIKAAPKTTSKANATGDGNVPIIGVGSLNGINGSNAPLSLHDADFITSLAYQTAVPPPSNAIQTMPTLPAMLPSRSLPHASPTTSTPRSILDSQPSYRAANHPFGSPTQQSRIASASIYSRPAIPPILSSSSRPLSATPGLGMGMGSSVSGQVGLGYLDARISSERGGSDGPMDSGLHGLLDHHPRTNPAPAPPPAFQTLEDVVAAEANR